MASNVSVSTVARLVVRLPHKVPIRSSCFDLLSLTAGVPVASNVSVSTVARLVVPHKVPI